jgi:hypothetical protein
VSSSGWVCAVPLELDHLFIMTSVGAPEAARLIEFGLVEGAPNIHPGQGTANRRFFFANAFLELLWVADLAEVQSELVRRTGLWQRWAERAAGASPFGVALRPAGQEGDDIPIPTWEYRPPYLPDPLAIHMGENSDVAAEPLVFYLAFGRRADSDHSERRQPLAHPAGLRAITRARISRPQHASPSTTLRAAEAACRDLSFATADGPLLEIGFDDELCGELVDFRPDLPLVLRW